jgi:DNA-binding NarL/FixJ family response regulator
MHLPEPQPQTVRLRNDEYWRVGGRIRAASGRHAGIVEERRLEGCRALCGPRRPSLLTDTSLAVYRHLVARGDADAGLADVEFVLGLTSAQLDEARRELVAARLVQVTRDGDRLVALSPEVALTGAVHDDESTVRELQAQIAARRLDYLGLLSSYNDARSTGSQVADVQVLDRLDTIRDFLADTCRDTQHELLIAHPTRHLSADSLEEGVPQDLEMLARGVARRTLYLSSNRDSVAVQRAVARTTQAGAEVRVLPDIPVRMMCFDQRIVMLSRNQGAGDIAAIVVRDAALADTIRQVYLAVWEHAEPFLTTGCDQDGPTELDRAILNELAQGYSDDQIARRQDISVRTCRRHIHDLTERLGSQTRFQAGVQAARRNWI